MFEAPLVLLLLAVAAYSDHRRRIVFNGVPLCLMGVGLVLGGELWHRALVGLMMLGITYLLWAIGLPLGAGDSKLLAALAFVYPWQAWGIMMLSGLSYLVFNGQRWLRGQRVYSASAPFILCAFLIVIGLGSVRLF